VAAMAAEAARRAAQEELDPETIPPVPYVTRRDLLEQEEREAQLSGQSERHGSACRRHKPRQKPELRRNDRWQQ
jgi:hypothetical protein